MQASFHTWVSWIFIIHSSPLVLFDSRNKFRSFAAETYSGEAGTLEKEVQAACAQD